MEIDSISYTSEGKIITVTRTDGSATTYTDRALYLADWPDREADCDAIGWA